MRFPSCVFCCFPNVTNCFSTRTSCFSGRERVKTGNLSRVAFWISVQNHLQSGDNTKSFFSSKVDIHPHQKNTTGVPNNFGPKSSHLKSSFPDFEGGFPPTCWIVSQSLELNMDSHGVDKDRRNSSGTLRQEHSPMTCRFHQVL